MDSDSAKNRSKSARVRAICAHARTQRIGASAKIAQIWRNLSGRDLPRSADHRHAFAAEENAKLTSFSDDSARLDEDGGVVEAGPIIVKALFPRSRSRDNDGEPSMAHPSMAVA
jgi:hypothetical protein